jgi:hypothetical protein
MAFSSGAVTLSQLTLAAATEDEREAGDFSER